MSVANILKIAQAKTGLNSADPKQREVLLRYLNEAAYEIHMQADLPGAVGECLLKVNGDQTIALPWYIGELRAVREYTSMIPWSINQMKPRYFQSNWSDFWRNWRLRNKQPLMSTVTNQSVLTIIVPTVESEPLEVTITGSTNTATSLSETVICTATSVSTVNQFNDVTTILKSKVTDYDVQIQDVDGKVMSVIPNTELSTWYTIVDISTMPWLPTSTSSLDHYVEVLFKRTLQYLSGDGDEFPANNCDHIVANKMIQIWYQESGDAANAIAFDQLTTRSLARKVEEVNRATQDKLGFVVNPHDTLNPRIRPRRPGRYGGYGATTRYGVV